MRPRAVCTSPGRLSAAWPLLGAMAMASGCTPAAPPLQGQESITAFSESEDGARTTGRRSLRSRRAAPVELLPKADSLPRLALLWSRPGLGNHRGTVDGNAYYTVANDGATMHAIDVATGSTLWQVQLPVSVGHFVDMRVVGDGVVLVSREPGDALPRASKAATVLRIASETRDVTWSRLVRCEEASLEATGPQLYLTCGEYSYQGSERVELDPATGLELARLSLEARPVLSSNGELCNRSEKEVWCGRLIHGELQKTWARRRARYDGTLFIEDRVIVISGTEAVAYDTRDGREVWKHAVSPTARFDKAPGHLTLETEGAFELLRISDGSSTARIPTSAFRGGDVLASSAFTLFSPTPPGTDRLYLVDAEFKVQTLARTGFRPDYIAGDVLLSLNAGKHHIHWDDASLDAYSLSRLAPPEDQLPPEERFASILERYLYSSDASEALAELRSIPSYLDLLEKVLVSGPERLKPSALDIAGASGNPRFLGPLEQALAQFGAPPRTPKEWAALFVVVYALRSIDSPDAGAALRAFWQQHGAQATPLSQREILRNAIARALWRYGSANTQFCSNTSFAIGPVTPDARLGTRSPSVEYALGPERRWASICEARVDDDHDGSLEVSLGRHGDMLGDDLRPYLVLGSGPGTELQDFVTGQLQGNYVVVTRDMCVHLVDTRSGHSVALRGADGRTALFGTHRAASFSPDGKKVLYIRTSGRDAVVVVRELASGRERVIDPGKGELSQAFFDATGRYVVMDLMVEDADGDGRLRSFVGAPPFNGRCSGPATSASNYRGEDTVRRVTPVTGGDVRDASPRDKLEPVRQPQSTEKLVAIGGKAQRKVQVGPLRWERRNAQ